MIKLLVGDIMNNKGFTLVEMLATVVILGVVMGIATYGVIGAINKSKEKSEEIFVDKLEKAIQTYINDNRFAAGFTIKNGGLNGDFDKCRKVKDDGTCFDGEDYSYEVNFEQLNNASLNDIADVKYIENGKIINPKNKSNCLKSENNPEILLFKDSDSVYYYYVDLSYASCGVSDNNSIITNIPKNMCESLRWTYEEEVCKKS